MAETVSSERLREILAGCDGVTLGPWHDYDDSKAATFRHIIAAFGKTLAHIYCTKGHEIADAANAAHIARLDPQTVASIVAELLAYRKAGDQSHG